MNPIFFATSVRIAIVDSSPEDYTALLEATGAPGVSIHFLLSSNDAIRFARRCPPGLWVINTQLPEMSGFDLAEMVRSVRPSALIFMIGDAYRLEDEMQALTQGLKYLCKPLEPSWILPDSQDFCIPLASHRKLRPALRVVSPSESGIVAGSPESVSLLGASDSGGENQVILPFNPNLHRRPAA